MGFCHCDLWSGNMLMKGENLIAIDFETASTGILVIKIVTIIIIIIIIITIIITIITITT